MHRARAVFVVAVILAGACLATAGDLQVTCLPGHRIYLDGVFVGLTTADQDGLYLRDVSAGPHTLRVEKLGFVPVERSVEVPETGPVEIQVLHLDATPEVRPAGVEEAPNASPPEPPESVGVRAAAAAVGASSPQPTGPVEHAEPSSVREPKAGQPKPAAAPEGAAKAPPERAAVEAGSAPAEAGAAGASPAAGDSPEAVLQRSPKPVADVMFGYRARGAGLTGGGSVTLSRERGGPRSPALVFWCVGDPECVERTRPNFAPGPYRFRASCRPQGDQQPAVDSFGELQARPGVGYLIDVTFTGPGDAGCTVQVHEVGAS